MLHGLRPSYFSTIIIISDSHLEEKYTRLTVFIQLLTAELLLCVCVFSANAVSSRDGLDTETGTESLVSQRRERERERSRKARDNKRKSFCHSEIYMDTTCYITSTSSPYIPQSQ